MIVRRTLLTNMMGLHLRPATMFAAIAQHYHSEIQVTYGGKTVTGKSPIGLLQLQAQEDCEITIYVEGIDENEAVQALLQLVQSGFSCSVYGK